MRKWIVLFSVALLVPSFGYADLATTTSAGATVSYSASTELACTDNATLNGNLCYCNKGFHIDANACVADVAAPVAASTGPTGPEIYQDIAVAVSVNSEAPYITCSQLGFVSATDLDMCTRYKAASTDDRLQWKIIPRPSATAGPAIANPWAPAGQQTFQVKDASGTQALLPLTPPPAPPPPPPDPATALPPLPAPPPPAPDPPPPPPDPPPPDPVAPPDPPPPPPPVQPDPTADAVPADDPGAESASDAMPQPSFAQIASADASQDAINISPDAPGLEPLKVSDLSLTPDEQMQEPVEQPSLFERMFGWFFGLF